MKKVYLIRHGLPDFPNGQRMCIGTTDLPMAKPGLLQATEMAKKLPPVTAVFSSPLIRAVQTAEAIGLPITVLDGLRELNAGEWDGLTFDQIRQRYPELYAARGKDLTTPLPGAEDHKEGLVHCCGKNCFRRFCCGSPRWCDCPVFEENQRNMVQAGLRRNCSFIF